MKSAIWKTLYSRWRGQLQRPEPGLSLLLLTPGDLPVFLKIALAVCARQNGSCLRETLVIPDVKTTGLTDLVASSARDWPHGEMRIVDLPLIDRLIIRRFHNPHFNCWLQFIRGVEAARSTHVLWHDADLFISDPAFLDAQHQRATEENLDCLGVSPVWDSWFRERGLDHVTATWELMLRADWIRSFKPWEHRGHDADWHGDRHTFDISLLPQARTPPERVGRSDVADSFIHFNYVICTYRWFQQSDGPYEDENFRILLVRLLIDAFDDSGWEYEAPSVEDLARGLTNADLPVTYLKKSTRDNYSEFRNKLQQLIESTILTTQQSETLSEGVSVFDRLLNWSNQQAPAAV